MQSSYPNSIHPLHFFFTPYSPFNFQFANSIFHNTRPIPNIHQLPSLPHSVIILSAANSLPLLSFPSLETPLYSTRYCTPSLSFALHMTFPPSCMCLTSHTVCYPSISGLTHFYIIYVHLCTNPRLTLSHSLPLPFFIFSPFHPCSFIYLADTYKSTSFTSTPYHSLT